jgi:hypothetical protein
MFADSSPQHGRGDVASASLLLGFVQYPENDAFLAREAVANVREDVAQALVARLFQGLNSVFSFFFTATPLIFT